MAAVSSVPRRSARSSALPLRGMEDRDDRHAVHDLARAHHSHDLRERERAGLDEFRLVRRKRKLRHLLAHEEVRRLVHDALAGVVGADVSQPRGAATDLLSKLTLGGHLDRLSDVDPARRHLPGRPARHVTVLPDEEDRIRIEEWEDAHALSATHHAVDRGASIGQLHEVLSEREPTILINGSREYRLPGDL